MNNFKILQNNFIAKNNSNKSNTVSFDFLNQKKIMQEDEIEGIVDAYNIYASERKKSGKIRLTCEINPICTNALFNPVTEIVMNEGSDSAFSLNYSALTTSEMAEITTPDTLGAEDLVIYKNKCDNLIWNEYEAVRDTQLSNSSIGFKYLCGIDIFNNHIIRSETFKSVRYTENSELPYTVGDEANKIFISKNFNTIDDYMRDSNGVIISDTVFYPSPSSFFYDKNSHLKIATISAVVDTVRTLNQRSSLEVKKITFKLTWKDGGNINFPSEKSRDVKITFHISTTVSDSNGNKEVVYSEPLISITLAEFENNKYVYSNTISLPDIEPGFEYSKDNDDYKVIITSVVENIVGEFAFIVDVENGGKDVIERPLHLYQAYDIYDFESAIERRLKEVNGWFGFYNRAKLRTYSDLKNTKLMDINKPLGYKNPSEFVDMYPTRDLFSFVPKYNPYRKRIECNWDYCVTYPSSSTTEGFDFFNTDINSLKVLMIDETESNDNGFPTIKFYCVSQHGLNVGDYINVYSNNDIAIENAVVSVIYNKYVFEIQSNTVRLSSRWIQCVGSASTYTFTSDVDGEEVEITYKVDSSNRSRLFRIDSENNIKYYYICPDNMRANVDDNAQNISFKKVINGLECKYYVRIFSKIPNWKFTDREINENVIYGDNGSSLLKKYTSYSNNFESHINKLGYAKNAYNDPIAEIVYTDDIDISYLKDNLGRPISDIFLTIVKRNKGYRKWYGIDKADDSDFDLNESIKDSDIEYSHCFGVNTCAFRLSDESLYDKQNTDIRTIWANRYGLYTKNINRDVQKIRPDEINIETDRNFYGDLCCYSPSDCDEETIQMVSNRFNTAQRELLPKDASYKYFSGFTFDDILVDEYNTQYGEDIDKNHTSGHTYTDILPRKEGYYYKPHYKIPINTVSQELKYLYPFFYTIKEIINTGILSLDGHMQVSVYTDESNSFSINTKFNLYDIENAKIYNCRVTKLITDKKFYATVVNEAFEDEIPDLSYKDNLIMFKRDESLIPSYAKVIKDGSCRFYWRDIIPNGFDTDDTSVESYPFANGALYVNRLINFYLRRQDPYKETSISFTGGDDNLEYESDGTTYNNVVDENDNYYEESEMKEC